MRTSKGEAGNSMISPGHPIRRLAHRAAEHVAYCQSVASRQSVFAESQAVSIG
jgi:hypothetical protein